MKTLRGSLLAALLVLGGCAMGQAGPKTYSNRVAPALTASAARTQVAVPLTIVVSSAIPEQATITRGQGQVVVQIQNYRAAIGETLSKAFASNFSSVSVAPAETKQGIELVVLAAQVGKDVDTLSYHVALTRDGKDVYEAKGEIKPAAKMVSTNAFSWKDTTAQLTTDFVSENIAKLAEEVNSAILINDDPRLTSFWQEVSNPTTASGGEAEPAPVPPTSES